MGARPEVIPLKALLDATFGMFIHANINVKFGKLKYFLNSPELHLWHHANYREVFHANFSTKFSVWDYLFGTVYDPGTKPGDQRDNWGLYYDYPKDYFLQHAFSLKRFDEKSLLKYKWFKWYYNLRPNLIMALKKTFGFRKNATIVKMRVPEPLPGNAPTQLVVTDEDENATGYRYRQQ
jgi:hypothetical protein